MSDEPRINHDSDIRERIAAVLRRRRDLLRARIRRRVGRAVHRVHDLEDIESTTLRRLDRMAARGDLDADPDELVILALADRIALDAVRDRARKHRIRAEFEKAGPLETAPSPLAGSSASTPDEAVTEERRRLLNAALDRLDDDQRDLLLLRANGRSWADIASARHSTVPAVRRRFWRLVARLREELTAEDETD